MISYAPAHVHVCIVLALMIGGDVREQLAARR